MLDWEGLLNNILLNGIRNSQVTGQMFSDVESLILGHQSGCEPQESNIILKPYKGGFIKCVNPYLATELISIGQWTD